MSYLHKIRERTHRICPSACFNSENTEWFSTKFGIGLYPAS